MKQPTCLDLYCCGGGAGTGYHRAGYRVTGVDIEHQENYPFIFMRGDALEFVRRHGNRFDLIHASPPCQGYSSHVTSQSSEHVRSAGKDEPKLISQTRQALIATGKPWVMENVIGSRRDLMACLLLCGSMFGLPISRHRIFESSHLILQPDHPKCSGLSKHYAQKKGWEYRDMSVTGKGRRAGTSERWKEIMGIDWDMSQHQLAEAIPPSFTEYIGRQFISILK